MADTNKAKSSTKEAKNSGAESSNDTDVEENKTIAALSYVWILFLVQILGKRKSKFAQFHAKQGFILFVIELIASLFMWFPIFGQLLMLALLIVAVMGFVKTLNGEWWEIPYIHEWSKKIKL
ncbi:MAG: hypothetical protein AAB906_01100 [Patescibacteria group bacterium]